MEECGDPAEHTPFPKTNTAVTPSDVSRGYWQDPADLGSSNLSPAERAQPAESRSVGGREPMISGASASRSQSASKMLFLLSEELRAMLLMKYAAGAFVLAVYWIRFFNPHSSNKLIQLALI